MLLQLEKWVQSDKGLLGDPAGNSPMKPEIDSVLQPHLTVWFDLPPEEAARRLVGARVPDKFEAQPVEFFRRVAQGYAERLAQDPARFARINAAQPREGVWDDIRLVFVTKGWAS